MATQGFIWKEITWPPGLLKEKQQQSRVFFGVSFYVYTNVDNSILSENTGNGHGRKKGDDFLYYYFYIYCLY